MSSASSSPSSTAASRREVVLVRRRVVEPGRIPDCLEHGPVRDAFAVGQTAAARDEGRLAESPATNSCTRRDFPTPGRAEDREQLARAVAGRLLERVVQAPPLPLAADHRRVEAALAADGARPHPQETNLLAVRLGFDRVADEPMRPLVEQDRSRVGELLQTERRSDGCARRAVLIAVAAGKHLARADADAELEPRTPLAFELVSQAGEPVPHLGGGGHRAERVVLVDRGDPEDRSHGPAQRALDGRAVTLERRQELVESARASSAEATPDRAARPSPRRRTRAR